MYTVASNNSNQITDKPYLQLRDSIIGNGHTSLATFTFCSATKYRRGGYEEGMGVRYLIHNALLVSLP